MDGGLRLPPLARILALNTESAEMQTELLHLPVFSVRISELQERMDRNCRSSLTACWLPDGLEFESYDDDLEGDWEDGLASSG